MARVSFLSISIDNLTMEEVIDEIDRLVKKGEPSYVVTPNIDHIVKLEEDEELREIYSKAALILADGKPLIWISKKMKKPIVEKVSGADLFPELCKLSAERGYRMFFLGAAEGVARKAAENMQKKYRGLNVCGTYSPPLGFEDNKEEIEKIIRIVRGSEADILIAAIGTPKQEKFIFKYYKELGTTVQLGLGGTLDYAAGTAKRAPKWMSDHGLEWLYRLAHEPGRLAKRYWNDLVKIGPIVKKYHKKEKSDCKG